MVLSPRACRLEQAEFHLDGVGWWRGQAVKPGLFISGTQRSAAAGRVAGRDLHRNTVTDLADIERQIDLVVDAVALLAGPARLAEGGRKILQPAERLGDL